MWPGWPQYLHRPSLFFCSLSSIDIGPRRLADDTSIGPACVLVAVEGRKVVVVTVAGAAAANLVVCWLVGLVLMKLVRFAEFELTFDL